MFFDTFLKINKKNKTMSLLDLITGSAGTQVAEQAENRFGVNKNQMIALAAVAAPLIISYLKNKSQQDPNEADALSNALDKDHDGSILDNPAQITERQEEGNSILNHIFGGQKAEVENQLSANTGISMSKIGPLLGMLAPLVMGYIGREKQNNSVGAGGLGDLLGGILGGAQSQAQAQPANPLNDILGQVLGGGGMQQASNNPLNDILGGMLGGGQQQQQQGGLGGLLGGLLGGR